MNTYANQTNPLTNPNAYHDTDRTPVYFTDFVQSGGMFTRIRLITEPGYPALDVSYIHGEIDGKPVRVEGVPFHHLGRKTYRSEIAATVKNCDGTKAQINNAWDGEVYSIMR